jgi:hypothetical protein
MLIRKLFIDNPTSFGSLSIIRITLISWLRSLNMFDISKFMYIKCT